MSCARNKSQIHILRLAQLLFGLLLPSLASAALRRAPPLPPPPDESKLLAVAAIGPVAHTAPRDQGDAGFCWAYSLSGYMEGEALKQGKAVTLSPEYLALNHMPKLLHQYLPLLEYIMGQSFVQQIVLDILILPNISPEGALSFSESLEDIAEIGMMPETVFQIKFPKNKIVDGKSVEIHPTLSEKAMKFITEQVMTPDNVKIYEKDLAKLDRDFFNAIGIHPPRPTAAFQFEGKTYTPLTFMKDYLQFVPSLYREVVVSKNPYSSLVAKIATLEPNAKKYLAPEKFKPITSIKHEEAFALIESLIKENTAVPLTFQIFEDQKTVEKTGVFTLDDCTDGKCKRNAGGHSVLVTGLKVPSDAAPAQAFIIKNSWGYMGLNDLGEADAKTAETGFFLIDQNYLTEIESFPKANGWSFLIQTKDLPSGLKP